MCSTIQQEIKKEGIEEMSAIISENMQMLLKKYTKERMRDTAVVFFANGDSFENVRAVISPDILSDEELRKLEQESYLNEELRKCNVLTLRENRAMIKGYEIGLKLAEESLLKNIAEIKKTKKV